MPNTSIGRDSVQSGGRPPGRTATPSPPGAEVDHPGCARTAEVSRGYRPGSVRSGRWPRGGRPAFAVSVWPLIGCMTAGLGKPDAAGIRPAGVVPLARRVAERLPSRPSMLRDHRDRCAAVARARGRPPPARFMLCRCPLLHRGDGRHSRQPALFAMCRPGATSPPAQMPTPYLPVARPCDSSAIVHVPHFCRLQLAESRSTSCGRKAVPVRNPTGSWLGAPVESLT